MFQESDNSFFYMNQEACSQRECMAHDLEYMEEKVFSEQKLTAHSNIFYNTREPYSSNTEFRSDQEEGAWPESIKCNSQINSDDQLFQNSLYFGAQEDYNNPLPQLETPNSPKQILQALASISPQEQHFVSQQTPIIEFQMESESSPRQQNLKMSQAKNISNIFCKRIRNIMKMHLQPSRKDLIVLLNLRGTSIEQIRRLLLNQEVRSLVKFKFNQEWSKFLEDLEKRGSTQISRYKMFESKMLEFINSPEQFSEWWPRPAGIVRRVRIIPKKIPKMKSDN